MPPTNAGLISKLELYINLFSLQPVQGRYLTSHRVPDIDDHGISLQEHTTCYLAPASTTAALGTYT